MMYTSQTKQYPYDIAIKRSSSWVSFACPSCHCMTRILLQDGETKTVTKCSGCWKEMQVTIALEIEY